jgi:hypothetical protein
VGVAVMMAVIFSPQERCPVVPSCSPVGQIDLSD